MNKTVLLLAFVGLVAALLFYFNGFTAIEEKVIPPAKPSYAELEQKYAPLTISFSSPLGFNVRYPIGYYAERLDSNQVRFVAPAGDLLEVFMVVPLNGSFNPDEYKPESDEVITGMVSKKRFVLGNGGTGYVYDFIVSPKELNTTAYVRQAVIPCAYNGSDYAAALTAVIPASVADDLDLADYMIYSFQC